MSNSFWIIGLAVSIICAVLCYMVAKSKGRSVVIWPIVGFIFPLIGLIIVFVLPAKD